MQPIKIRINSVDEIIEFVNICSKYDCDINIYDGSMMIDAKSFLGVNGVSLGKQVSVQAITSNDGVAIDFVHDIEKWIVTDEN